jgi:hypothetical protein
MDRRHFLLSGGAATAAAAAASTQFFSPASVYAPAAAAGAAPPTSKAAAPVEPVRVPIQAAAAGDTAFQLAFVPHPHQRGVLARHAFDAPLRVVFYGFGFRADNSTLQALTVDAGFLAPDASALRHMTWAWSKRGSGNPVGLTLARTAFAGFLTQASVGTSALATKVGAIETYVPGGDVPWEYGSYVLASRSHDTGRWPDWSQFTFSGNAAQPLALIKSAGVGASAFDFDYLTFEVTRDAV